MARWGVEALARVIAEGGSGVSGRPAHNVTVLVVPRATLASENGTDGTASEAEIERVRVWAESSAAVFECLTRGELAVVARVVVLPHVSVCRLSRGATGLADLEQGFAPRLALQDAMFAEYAQTDTFMLVYETGDRAINELFWSQSGLSELLPYQLDGDGAQRGNVQLPLHMALTDDVPGAFVRELFHALETNIGFGPRWAWLPRNRHKVPEWHGDGELDYFAWRMQRVVEEYGARNINWRLRYPLRLSTTTFDANRVVAERCSLAELRAASELAFKAKEALDAGRALDAIAAAREALSHNADQADALFVLLKLAGTSEAAAVVTALKDDELSAWAEALLRIRPESAEAYEARARVLLRRNDLALPGHQRQSGMHREAIDRAALYPPVAVAALADIERLAADASLPPHAAPFVRLPAEPLHELHVDVVFYDLLLAQHFAGKSVDGVALRGGEWSHALLFLDLARAELRARNEARADVLFERALRLAPNTDSMLREHATRLYARGLFAEAIVELERALDLRPHSCGACFLLARCVLRAHGDLGRATRYFAASVIRGQRAPSECADSLSSYASSADDLPLERRLELFAAAQSWDPRCSAVYWRRAWVLRGADRRDEARDDMLLASQLGHDRAPDSLRQLYKITDVPPLDADALGLNAPSALFGLDAPPASLLARLRPTATPERRIRVGVYNLKHNDHAFYMRKFIDPAPDLDVEFFGPAELLAGDVFTRIDVFVNPGGMAPEYFKPIGDTGAALVRSFVERGGGFVGICAGAFLAATPTQYALVRGDEVFDRQHWRRGVGDVQIRFTALGRRLLEPQLAPLLVHHTDGVTAAPLCGDEGATLTLRYANGPLLRPLPADAAQGPALEPLAYFVTGLAENGAPDVQAGQLAIGITTFGRGRVLACSPHPEYFDGDEGILAQAVRAVAPSDGVTSVASSTSLGLSSPPPSAHSSSSSSSASPARRGISSLSLG